MQITKSPYSRLLDVRSIAVCLTSVATLFASTGFNSSTDAQTANATIRIEAAKPVGRISPFLYGQFIEFMFEGVKRGLSAEMLLDGSFEAAPNEIGLPRYWERYPDDRNDDYALNFNWDPSNHYPPEKNNDKLPEHSLRIDLGEGVIPRHGIFQSRISVVSGADYKASLWISSSSAHASVIVALESDTSSGTVYAESEPQKIAGSWRRYDFTLHSTARDALARFAILFDGTGVIWIDRASLMPANAVGAVRKDVFEMIRDLHPAFLRWPGGNVAQIYRWQSGIGPRDSRPRWINYAWKNEIESNEFGTDEFVSLCRAVGAEPSFTVNVNGPGASVSEAAAWVEYCNGASDSKYGSLRSANGHPQPYGVKFWEVGNEIWNQGVSGHTDALTYARNFREYATAMRAVDPSIKLIAVGDNDMDWNRSVLTVAGGDIDLLSVHHYYSRGEIGGDRLNLMARPLFYEDFYRRLSVLCQTVVPAHAIGFAVNEWGLDLGLEQQYSIESALYAARLQNVFERSAGIVGMSAVSDLVNGWPGGIIQAGRTGLFVSPIFLVNKLYSEHRGNELLNTVVTGPDFNSTRAGHDVPVIDGVASFSLNRRQVYLKVVNTDASRTVRTNLIVEGARLTTAVHLQRVNAERLDRANSFATPAAVTISETEIELGSPAILELPPHSVSVFTLNVSRPDRPRE